MTQIKKLEFAHIRLRGTGENVQTYSGSGNERKRIDPFVSNRVALKNRFPILPIPHFNSIVFDVLAIIQPFHGQGVIEGDRVAKISLENGMMRSQRRGPECIRSAVEGSAGGGIRHV